MTFAPLSRAYGETTELPQLPGDIGMPILGHTLALLRDPGQVIADMHARFGRVYHSRGFFRVVVTLLGPDANQFVLLDKERNFSSYHGWAPILDRLFPNGLMLRDFDDHLFHRRIMQAAFRREALERYVVTLDSGIRQAIPTWGAKGGFAFYPAIKQLTLDLAAQLFLGMPLGPEAQAVNTAFTDLVAASMAIIKAPIPGTAFRRGIQGRAYLETLLRTQISSRQASGATDMFSQLCRAQDDEGRRFSDQEIIDHMIFLMMAAHDTLTSTLSTLIYHLAKAPEWQEALRAEYRSIARTSTDEVALTFADLEQFPKTEWALKEALRLNPPLDSIGRRSVRAFEWEGHTIPANTVVTVVPSFTHRMPELWTNPDAFDPERFSPERAEDKRHRFAWIPFGGGAHVCIGMQFAILQTRIFLFHLLTRYRIEVKDGYTTRFQVMPISKPLDGLPIRLVPLASPA